MTDLLTYFSTNAMQIKLFCTVNQIMYGSIWLRCCHMNCYRCAPLHWGLFSHHKRSQIKEVTEPGNHDNNGGLPFGVSYYKFDFQISGYVSRSVTRLTTWWYFWKHSVVVVFGRVTWHLSPSPSQKVLSLRSLLPQCSSPWQPSLVPPILEKKRESP